MTSRDTYIPDRYQPDSSGEGQEEQDRARRDLICSCLALAENVASNMRIYLGTVQCLAEEIRDNSAALVKAFGNPEDTK